MKTCTKCGIEKPLGEYHKQKAGKQGLRGKCKTCIATYDTERNAHPEVKAQRAEYYKENREVIVAQKAAYGAFYYAEYNARPEVKAHSAEYRAANPHIQWESHTRHRAKRFGFTPVIESFTRDELIAKWGDECFHCKGEWSELDHFPIPISKGGHHIIENARPSCLPCNRKSWKSDTNTTGDN